MDQLKLKLSDESVGGGSVAYATEAEPDLYDRELASFRELLKQDLPRALERYGFAFYFSLPDAERLRVLKHLGLAPRTAADFYNLAALEIEKGNFAEATELLRAALEREPKLTDALYNLALCYEKAGKRTEAVKAWEQYLTNCTDPQLREQVTAHLAELASH